MGCDRGRSLSTCLLLILSAAGCSDESGGGCAEDRECDLPELCVEGACVLECRRDRECQRDQLCVDSECRSARDGCRRPTDCEPFGLVCDLASRACVTPGGEGGLPVADARSDTLPFLDLGRPDGGLPDGARPPPDGAHPPTDDGSRPLPDGADPPPDGASSVDGGLPDGALPDAGPLGAYGERCRCGTDCESGFCVENKLRGARTCTELCADASTCPGLDNCLMAQVPAGGGGCPPPRPGGPRPGDVVGVCYPNETGLPCERPDQCTEGVCLTPPAAAPWVDVVNVCAGGCVNDRKCPAGYRCQEVMGNMGPVRVCAPAVEVNVCPNGQAAECGGTCPIADDTLCLAFENQRSGYCSCACRSAADCPLGFACNQDPQGGASVCLLMAGYRCPGGDDAHCPSLTCAVDDAQDNRSFCTAFCGDGGDCPANHRCDPVPGTALSVCTPDE